jgi:hypothetical protein
MSRHDGTFALRATTEMSSASLEQAAAQTVPSQWRKPGALSKSTRLCA